MADEANISENAQLSICIRYLYTESDKVSVTEDCLVFVELELTNAESITCAEPQSEMGV